MYKLYYILYIYIHINIYIYLVHKYPNTKYIHIIYFCLTHLIHFIENQIPNILKLNKSHKL